MREQAPTKCDYREAMDARDGLLTRIFWRILIGSERVLGDSRARALAAGVLRFRSRTRAGYVRSTYRLVSRAEVAAGVLKLPTQWWANPNSVSVNRLGLRFTLDLRDNLQRVLYFTGTYEPDVLHRIENEMRKGEVFVDCGAHIGVHALSAASRLRTVGGGKVYAFEPAPDTAANLRRAAAANQLDIEVVPLALSDDRRTMALRTDERYGAADLGVRSEYGSGQPIATIDATTFDEWAKSVGLKRLDVVKIDVEGGELSVLRGMHTSLPQLCPRLVIVETKAASLERAGVTRADIHTYLESLGYRCEATVPFSNDIFVPVP
jgi:FkbM family methyltransferase